MAGTIVLYSQLSYLQDRKLGFNKEQVVLFPTGVAKILDQYDALKSTLLQDPHIRSVTSASFVPGRSAGASRLLSLPVRLEDQPEQSKLDVPLLYYDFGFEKTFEFQLTAGRFFSDEFATDRYREALILNESAIRRLGFGTSEDAIGARIDVGDIFVGTVVGVVEDFHIRSLHHAVEPVVVMPTKANGSYESHVAMRIESGKASEALASIEAVWASFFPQLPFTYTFLDDDFQRLYDVEQRLGRVYAVFALIAIGIACLGLFGLASFMAERRTRETGIRKVLGASTASILNLLTREFLILVIVANVIAWPVTYYFLQQWLENFAYRTTVHWGAFLLAGVTAVGIAVATIAYQSIRAALANPVDALRHGE